jgi:nitrite reductase (NADH) large subunit
MLSDLTSKGGKFPPLVPYTEDIRLAPDTETVCYCSGVSKGDILAAAQRGARTVADIKAATGACTLGRCKETNPRGR